MCGCVSCYCASHKNASIHDYAWLMISYVEFQLKDLSITTSFKIHVHSYFCDTAAFCSLLYLDTLQVDRDMLSLPTYAHASTIVVPVRNNNECPTEP